VDTELERLEEREVAPVVKEKTIKKGEMAPPPNVAGVKRSRDAILAELKASRAAAAEAKAAAQPVLGSKFRRIGEKRETRTIKRDERGREVLIVEDEEGNIKRKIRKARPELASENRALLMPDKDAKPLGMEVPDLKVPATVEEEDVDIFEGVGTEYNPLGDVADDDDVSSEEDGDATPPRRESSPKSGAEPSEPAITSQQPAPVQDNITQPALSARNYFNDAPAEPEPRAPLNPLDDPSIREALKRASAKAELLSDDRVSAEDEERRKKRALMLAAADRDYDDMDMGFGSSRLEDDEEAMGGKVKLSQWKGSSAGMYDEDEDGEGGKEGKKKKKKKRPPKKRKGDKDSAADVLRVLQSRKKSGR
jgi:hypothetical protein